MVKKGYILLYLCCLLSFSLTAQVGIKGGFSLAVPANPNNGLQTYLGAHLGLTYQFEEHWRTSLMAEGVFKTTKNIFGDTLRGIIPVVAVVDYLFSNTAVHPYIGMGIGAYFSIVNSRYLGSTTTYLGMQPHLGLIIELADNLYFDLSVKYHLLFANPIKNAFGFNVGFDVQL